MKFPKLSLLKLLFVFLLIGCAQVPDPRLFTENKLAIRSLLEKNFAESKDHFVTALQYDPFRPELHTNLGVSFQLAQDFDKALQSFKKAEELSVNPEMQFVNRYDQGQLLGAQKKIDEALLAYQNALELNPASKEIKTNIELLIQSQQKNGKGEGQSKDDSDNKDKSKDPKKDSKDDEGKDQDKEKNKDPNQGQERKQSAKYKPREFKGEMQPSDVNKILGEIKSQEQKIRAQYNKNEMKDKPRDKDW